MNSRNFFAELKRRNVIRFAAGLYLVGAWLLTQVASTVLPMFGAPDWLPRSIVILLVIGFVPALIFSWVFELTPQGLKRDEDVPAEQSIAPQTGRRMNRMIIAVLVIALAYFAVDKFVLSQRRERSAAKLPSSELNAVPNEKSVAVLAFANLSDDKGSEYFSDGISEELLTVLQKIPGLHVAARTSAFSFKGKNATAQEIGQKLGVAHLVEGSVRKAGDVVRIAARLTQANTGEEQWSENYTRNLKDVFAVQTEIAQTIVEQLRGQLTGGAANPTTKAEIQAEVRAAEKGGTKNVEAHESYLQGRFFENRHSEKERAKLWLLTNTRSRWTLGLLWPGPELHKRTAGLPRLRPRADKKPSMLICRVRVTQRRGRSPLSLTCQRRYSPAGRSRRISILTGTGRLKR